VAAAEQCEERNRLLNDLHCVGLIAKSKGSEFTRQNHKTDNFLTRFDVPLAVFSKKKSLDRGRRDRSRLLLMIREFWMMANGEILVTEQNHVVEQLETQ
jgi:hypothetical protein